MSLFPCLLVVFTFAFCDQIDSSRPGFSIGTDVWGKINPNNQFNLNGQISTIAQILGSQQKAQQYISGGNFYLARGHLVPNAAFVYNAQQRATFYYENVAPQWQTLNCNNWKILESDVRMYAMINHVDLEVYTGTHNVTTLEDIHGNQQELYLYVGQNNVRAIPVPKLFWMMVINKAANTGVVCLSVNNPYIKTPGPDYVICNNVTNQITWLKWKPNDRACGISYCCDVASFMRKVPGLPSIRVTNLLK